MGGTKEALEKVRRYSSLKSEQSAVIMLIIYNYIHFLKCLDIFALLTFLFNGQLALNRRVNILSILTVSTNK